MRWYEGSIAEAVAASKANGAIFVVYIEGKDDKSKEFTDLINSEDVSLHMEQKHFVSIKIEESSVPHQQFSEIYTNATVPSIFFIGKTGLPLEIINESHSKIEFLNKLQSILQKHDISTTTWVSTEGDSLKDESDVAVDDLSPSTSNTAANDDTKAELTSEEKIERAQELINKKRVEKQAEDDAKQRLKEMERRKMGQDVQKLKRWQQDQELKEMMEERNKEKKEQLEARQRVLAQIAQDKAERAAKFSNVAQSVQQPTSNAPQSVARNNNIARLQFKFPDGRTHAHEFQSNNTLQNVRDYINKNLDLPFPNFTLSTTFPRREFTTNDNSETLLNLQLVPNAVILILPLQHGAVHTRTDSSISSMIWTILAPILSVMNYLKVMIFGGNPSSSTNSQRESKSPIDENEGTSSLPKRKNESTVIRRHGNVHRLQDNTDSDDDNNTWNGNSTQQM